jgi:transposase
MDGTHKIYRVWDSQQGRTLSTSPQDALPEGDLVFFLLDTIATLDLSAFHARYTVLRGQPPYDVTLLVSLLVYAYCVGIRSSRKIAAACERNLAFLAIVGDQRPNFRTISDFRKLHLKALEDLFVEVLPLAGELGMVKLGNLSTDGTKMGADASWHKAMSYAYMGKELERLRDEIQKLLAEADQLDGEDDAAWGSRRGDELPDELKRREARVQKIAEAKARLERAAATKVAEEQQRREAAEAQRQAAGRKRGGKEPKPAPLTPEDKAQTSFTDPESKIMKQSNKGFDQSYNAQAVVDSRHQIIVAAAVTNESNDKKQAAPMARAALANLEAAGIEKPKDEHGEAASIPNTLDNGYFSEPAVGELEQLGLDPHIATGRQKHNQTPTPVATDAAAKEATVKEKMTHKLRTATGKALYAARKTIVEPVFGQIKGARGIRRFLLRGLEKVRAEWQLICLTHNLLKIWRFTSTARGG